MRPITSEEIRRAFLEYFQEMGHQVVASSPLRQKDNPTLLFTNAGMNQFAGVFLGQETRPYLRAASAQKCMRVQGKHNDLENVGPSKRHHTFFEMLGNFSFGDYFKQGAIRYAFDFITKVCQVPRQQLWYTVHKEDDEAYDIWVKEVGVEPGRVLRMGDKTNFWMMGEVGPCGPTSELHYDWGPEQCSCGRDDCSVLLDNDCDRWLEIWNLVFMQYNQEEDGTRKPLPKPGVDTGMGLERITSVVQQTPVNYDNDLFSPVMGRIQHLLGDGDEERRGKFVGYRVIADHARAAAFLLADGVLPGNVGAGYVLRMIIRRAARFGRKIGFQRPFLADVAAEYIGQMGNIYGELERRREFVLRTLTGEEERFARTLDTAMEQLEGILQETVAAGGGPVSGQTAFHLYATHGLPLEITRDVAAERGVSVDEAGFNEAREVHAAASGAGAFGKYETGSPIFRDLLEMLIATGRLDQAGVDHDPYGTAELEAEIVALLQGDDLVDQAGSGDAIAVVTGATPFYVESGGEVSDTGRILVQEEGVEVRVSEMRQPLPGLILHVGKVVRGDLRTGQIARLEVDNERRRDIRRNHTATHILHRELRAHLGSHVLQAGSLVAPERLRFDFTYDQAVGQHALQEIEADINRAILKNYPVRVGHMPQQQAIDAGAMALFGEKYGDVVRTIEIGGDDRQVRYSFELCGGLHVENTAEIGLFRFLGEGAVGAGLRRVEAVTGQGALALVRERFAILEQAARELNAPIAELALRVKSMAEEQRQMQKRIDRLQRQLARGQFEQLLDKMEIVQGVPLMAAQVEVAGAEGLREMADWFRDKVASGVAVFGTISNGKPLLVASVSQDLIQRGLKAGDIVRQAAAIVGGGGGGRADMAQAGGRDASKLDQALAAVASMVENSLDR